MELRIQIEALNYHNPRAAANLVWGGGVFLGAQNFDQSDNSGAIFTISQNY